LEASLRQDPAPPEREQNKKRSAAGGDYRYGCERLDQRGHFRADDGGRQIRRRRDRRPQQGQKQQRRDTRHHAEGGQQEHRQEHDSGGLLSAFAGLSAPLAKKNHAGRLGEAGDSQGTDRSQAQQAQQRQSGGPFGRGSHGRE